MSNRLQPKRSTHEANMITIYFCYGISKYSEQSTSIRCDNSNNCYDGYSGNNARPILIDIDSDDETENMSACLTPSSSGSVVSREATVNTSSLVCSDYSVMSQGVLLETRSERLYAYTLMSFQIKILLVISPYL